MPETVEGAGIHQRLEAFAVHAARHALHKVVNVCKQAVFFPFPEDGLHDVGTEALDGTQGKAHVSVLVHGEVVGTFVDVRAQHLDAMAFAVVHDLGDFLHALGTVEAAGEKLRRIVAFEPACLVAHPGITGGVGLVEGILGKLLPVFPDLVQHLFRMPVGGPARHEFVLEGVQDVDLLLSHGLAQLVGLAFGEAGQLLGKQHHLFLVHGDAVGVLQIFLHFGKVVFDGLLALFAGHEVRDIIHRPGPIEGVHGNQVLEAGRAQFLQPGFHALGFELEHGRGVSAAVQLVGGGVVDGDGFNVDVFPVVLLDEVQAVMDDGQGDEAQEVHLEHAHLFDVMPVILRRMHVQTRFLVLGQADGEVVGKVSPADDGGAGMHAHLPHRPLQRLGIFQHLPVDFRPVLQLLNKLRDKPIAILEGNLDIYVLQAFLVGFSVPFHPLEAGFEVVQLGVEGVFLFLFLAQAVRDHLGEAVALVDGDAADARDVLDGALGRHGAEGNHAGDMAGPVLFLHIVVRLGEVFEVHVDIRHGDAVRIQEPLEQELVLDRVQIGDFEAVGHHGYSPGR